MAHGAFCCSFTFWLQLSNALQQEDQRKLIIDRGTSERLGSGTKWHPRCPQASWRDVPRGQPWGISLTPRAELPAGARCAEEGTQRGADTACSPAAEESSLPNSCCRQQPCRGEACQALCSPAPQKMRFRGAACPCQGQEHPKPPGLHHPAQDISAEQLTPSKGFALLSRVKVKRQQMCLVSWASQDWWLHLAAIHAAQVTTAVSSNHPN